MKKLVTLVLLFCTTFIFGQGTTALMNWEAKQYLKEQKKEVKVKEDTIKKAVEIQVKKQVINNTPSTEVLIYCGREGHMMALGNLFHGNNDGELFDKVVKWLRVIFLNQQMPNESDTDYKARIECLGLPANQPSK